MGLYVGDTRVAPVLRVMPNFKGTYNLIDNLELTLDATEAQITTALASAVNNPLRYDYCLVEKPWYQVHEGYASFTSVDDYVDYYVIYNSAYELVTNANKSSLGIVPKTTVAYILNNAYSVVRYNFDGTDWTSADNSGYATVNADNFTDSGTTFLSGLGMPSERKESFTVGSSLTVYTAPANGWVKFSAVITTTGRCGLSSFPANTTVYNNNTELVGLISNVNSSGTRAYSYIPIKKGEQFRIIYNNLYGGGDMYLFFIYAEGTPTQPQP